MPTRSFRLLLLLGALLPFAAAAEEEGAEPNAGAPFSVGDAYTSEAGAFTLENVFGYERARGGREDFRPSPTLKYGLNDRLELSLGGDYGFGNGSGVNQGSIGPALTARLADQDGFLPTLSLSLGAGLPFGPGHGGTVMDLTVATSWVTGSGPGSFGLHLNAGFLSTLDPAPGERRNGWLAGAAVSHVVNPDTVLVAAYSQQTQDEGERNYSLVEAGVIRGLTDQLSLGLAAGAGLNRDSPRLRLTASLTYSFSTGR
ncbi:transporter [Falsiroseomonas sp.]|uniref:transporter n=1 Tax=Falsiroseomonas sp. TaxID=2870721 RepID=UPI003F6E4A0F